MMKKLIKETIHHLPAALLAHGFFEAGKHLYNGPHANSPIRKSDFQEKERENENQPTNKM